MLCEFNRVISYVSFTYSENSNSFTYIYSLPNYRLAVCKKERKEKLLVLAVSKATLGKRLRDGVERMWAFPSV